METAIVGIIALLTVGGMVGFVALLIRHQRKTTAERIAACEARGWQYSERKNGFQIAGESDGVQWTMTLRVTKGANQSNGRTETIWEASAPTLEDVVLFGPKLPPVLAKINLGGSLVQFALSYLLGSDAKDLADVQEVQSAGSASFNEQFTVLATSSECAEALIDSDLEAIVFKALAKLKKPLVVLRWRDRIQVRLFTHTKSPADMDAMVKVGLEVASQSARPQSERVGRQLTDAEQRIFNKA